MTRRWIGWGVCALALCASVFVDLVSADVPGTVTLSTPAGVVKTARPGFTWTSLADADEYQLQVSLGGAAVHQQWYLASVCAGGSCSVTPALTLADGSYEWTVQARNGSGDGAWATAQPFSVSATGALGAGFAHSLSADRIGSLWSFGSNGYGQLGDGSTATRLLPTPLANPTAIALAAGEGHSVALRADGRVFAWGRGASGQLGQGTTSDSLTPLEVSGLTNVAAIASGKDHVLVLLSDGTVKAFGSNSRGQLGDGSTTDRTSPVAVSGVTNIVAIAAGRDHSLAVKNDGTLHVWGANDVGQLGDGTTTDRTSPTQVSSFTDAAAVFSGSAANHSLVLKSDGTAWAFGRNAEGQLGDGTASDRTSPVQMSGLTNVLALAAGEGHTLILRTDGTVYSTGRNDSGQLGDGTTTARDTAAQVSGLSSIVAIAAGQDHSLALKDDGSVFGFGENQDGQLGNGTTDDVLSPVTLSGSGFSWQAGTPVIGTPAGTYQADQSVTLTSASAGATIHYTTNGIDPTDSDASVSNGGSVLVSDPATLKARACAGGSSPSNVAAATYAFKPATPTAQPAAGTWAGPLPVTLQTATTSSTIRYTTDGSEPTGSATLYAAPLSLAASGTVRAKAFRANWQDSDELSAAYTIQQAGIAAGNFHSLAVLPDGSAWAWGGNGNGQLGDGTTTQKRVPTAVSGLSTGVVAVTAGEYASYALLVDGSVKSWGWNQNGRLGDGTTTQRTTPVTVGASVPAFVGLTRVSSQVSHALALKSNGQVYAWGLNTNGGLGDGSATQRTSPVLVSGISTATSIAAGKLFSLVLKSDGTVWSFGLNANGQLGDNSTTQRLTPVQVSGLTNVVAIAAGYTHGLALKSDGTVWAWGKNANGQLGDGSTTQRLTPVQVGGGLGGVVAIAATENVSIFLKSDGTLWATGYNGSGQIGDGTTTQRTSPVAVLQVANGVQIAGDLNHVLAITENGEIWSWGSGTQGEIGDGASSNRSTPVKAAEAGFVWKVGRPAFSAGTGNYQSVQNVTLTTDTPGGLLHYTTDGTDPDEGDPSVASGGVVVVDQSLTLKAIGFKAGLAASYATSATYTMTVPNVGLSPGTATYSTPQVVTVSCALAGASIHYTTNGQTPTTGDPTIASGATLPVNQSLTLKAKAFRPGWNDSAFASATYTLKVGTPTLTPPGGSYAGAQNVVVATTTPGAELHFTTNGLEPGLLDPVIASGASVVVDGQQTLKVKGLRAGWTTSDTTTGSYWISYGTAAAPTFAPAAGAYAGSQSVTLSSATLGAEIRYTTDGSVPTLASPRYSKALAVDGNVTLRARAFKAGYAPSATVDAAYDLASVALPVLSPAGGTYATARLVTITSSTPGAEIHYTTDGSEPTEADLTYATPIAVNESMVVRAGAWLAGSNPSGTARADYAITGQVEGGNDHSVALTSSGAVWTWGANSVGQIGDNTTTARWVPTPIAGLQGVSVAAGTRFTLVAKADGTVAAWGYNASGQLGDGTTTQRNAPVAVPGLTGVVAVAAGGDHSLALKADGTVVAWGRNSNGQLGDGTTTQRTAPVAVSGLTGVVAIAAGTSHSLALKADGTLYAWGLNSSGQLGDGTTTQRTAPVPVTIGPVRAIGAGEAFSVALVQAGGAPALYSWGADASYQLGDGSVAPRLAPGRGLEGALLASAGRLHAVAVRADGVWAWGENAVGALGDGTTTDRPTPIQLDELPQMLQVAAGGDHTLAIDADGHVWAWGSNGGGRLGDGTTTQRNAPVMLASLSLASNAWLGEDADGDGITNGEELAQGSDPLDADTNGDGLSDAASKQIGRDPVAADLDADGLANAAEIAAGTDPMRADSDGDGVLDGADAFPLDATKSQAVVNPADVTPPQVTLASPAATPIP